MKKRKVFLVGLAVFTGVVYLGNASWLREAYPENREILAHRGLHQTFDPTGVENDTCTANRIDPVSHNFLENTLPSIEAAINMGADIIEIDIHPTTDGQFVVFHDWMLECRTDGTGVIREQTSNYLKTLDIGYGYTADEGQHHPFRGQFVGAMPTLDEVLKTFATTHFLINIKGNDVQEVDALTDYLYAQNYNRDRLSIYGGNSVNQFKSLNPDIMVMAKNTAKTCLKSYVLTGWSGHIPKSCHDTYVPVPENFQWVIWGWPAQFETRLAKVGSRAILMGPKTKARANRAIDSQQSIDAIPKDFGGIVWTNRIDLFAER